MIRVTSKKAHTNQITASRRSGNDIACKNSKEQSEYNIQLQQNVSLTEWLVILLLTQRE